MDNQGEQAMTPDRLQETVPDLVSPKGQGKVSQLVIQAQKVKPELDAKLKMVAQESGLDPTADFESRLKNPDTLVKKVAVHREAGKDGYRANDVNDLYGARFIADTPTQKKDIINKIRDLNSDNFFKIDKEEQVDHGTYHAYHIDVNKRGVKAEIQIHDPHSLFESVTNHEIRAQHGENPPEPLARMKSMNATVGYKLPADRAQMIAQAIQMQRAQQGR